MNKPVNDILDKIKAIHDKKSADYANDDNRYQNFERAAIISDWFTDPVDRVFATLIGVKLARIAELSKEGKVPNNESLEDSRLDLCTYNVLWMAYRMEKSAEIPKGHFEVLYPGPGDPLCTCSFCRSKYRVG